VVDQVEHTHGRVPELSQSLKKQEDGLRLGADHYRATNEPETFTDLAGRFDHGIGADIEVIPADEVNEAYEGVLASDVRYRFVIDTATLA
jgi:alcohol dehydrogenase (NADP+)